MDHEVIKRVIAFVAPSVAVTCAYTCEIVPKKQDFLMSVMHADDSSCCFKNVVQMGELTAECVRHKTESGRCDVPTDADGVHIVATGGGKLLAVLLEIIIAQ
jgi:hypothetical protein